MKILPFMRMKFFRNGSGRVNTVLKLTLPRIEDVCDNAKCFNLFYEQLCEKIINCAANMISDENKSSRPWSVNLLYADVTEEYLKQAGRKYAFDCVAIKRTLCINRGGEIRKTESTDIYDFTRGIFVK